MTSGDWNKWSLGYRNPGNPDLYNNIINRSAKYYNTNSNVNNNAINYINKSNDHHHKPLITWNINTQ